MPTTTMRTPTRTSQFVATAYSTLVPGWRCSSPTMIQFQMPVSVRLAAVSNALGSRGGATGREGRGAFVGVGGGAGGTAGVGRASPARSTGIASGAFTGLTGAAFVAGTVSLSRTTSRRRAAISLASSR